MIKRNRKATSCYCFGCRSHKDDTRLCEYAVQSEALKTILRVDYLNLCYICKKIAKTCEKFIQNVKNNQDYLENVKSIVDLPLLSNNYQPVTILSKVCQNNINIIDEDLEKSDCLITDDNVNIKLEPKDERGLGPIETELVVDNDCQGSSINGEESILEELKEEPSDNINLKQLKKTLQKDKLEKKEIQGNKVKKRNVNFPNQGIKVIHITKEQCLKERIKMFDDPKYKNCAYKCENCIKGFNFKETYEQHMEKHSKVMGEFECDICKRRMESMDKLISHQKYHKIRYQCVECGLTRINRLTIKDHYTALHLSHTFYYKCPQCSKEFSRQVSLRKHITSTHRVNKRVKCKYCQKSYVNENTLKGHIMLKHDKELSDHSFKKHICQACGSGFKTPSQLKYHMTKHSVNREFYCVECDRGFKSHGALTQHLKIASPHVNYLQLPLQCEHCEKRFGVRRDLERHMNRIHLNIKPYQCDKCERAYVTSWCLTEHKRFSHEGKKRPLKYPCPLCDKVFARNNTRKSHILTHTGERPYMCTKCPAKFSQSSVLGTHVRLVHLKLTRDGQPKKQSS